MLLARVAAMDSLEVRSDREQAKSWRVWKANRRKQDTNEVFEMMTKPGNVPRADSGSPRPTYEAKIRFQPRPLRSPRRTICYNQNDISTCTTAVLLMAGAIFSICLSLLLGKQEEDHRRASANCLYRFTACVIIF